MPGLSDSFFANKSFIFAAVALAFLAAAVLLSVIYRLTFGRRLRLPGSRARLPRLGTVDAFDLDRQRQLVIVRRDNVEHLIMIGGPNDLLIESQIIRAESRDSRDFREPRIRDKEVRDAPLLPAGESWSFPAEAPSPHPPRRKMPVSPASMPEPETRVTGGFPVEGPEFASPAVSPASRAPAFPMPPRRAPSPAAPAGPRTPLPREPLHRRADPAQRSEPVTTAAKELRRASVTTPFLRPSTNETSVKPVPTNVPVTPSAEQNTQNSRSGSADFPASPEAAASAGTAPEPMRPTIQPDVPALASDDLSQDVPVQATVDTLEAEMAKLLGRGPG